MNGQGCHGSQTLTAPSHVGCVVLKWGVEHLAPELHEVIREMDTVEGHCGQRGALLNPALEDCLQ